MKSAKAIATGLGGGEVKVLSVTDAEPETAGPEPSTNIFAMMEGLSAAAAAKSNAGEVEIRVRVVVRCSY